MQHYVIRAESRALLIVLLQGAEAGKSAPFVVEDEAGMLQVDTSRIRHPYEEVDEEEGEHTGYWRCEIWLDAPDAELAELAL